LNGTSGSFLASLASSSLVLGGGAASAQAGAFAAGLVAMVAELSASRPRYRPLAATIEFGRREGRGLERVTVELADADADSFAGYIAASGLPRITPEEAAARRSALSFVAAAAIGSQRTILAACLEVVSTAERFAERSNPGLASDLVVASRVAEGADQRPLVNFLKRGCSLREPETPAAGARAAKARTSGAAR
jgi:formiminotetrahydrofolate cyclodeaminase/glutamate formiminotransferase/formiminotetrahydrofolate cyclodeaminase